MLEAWKTGIPFYSRKFYLPKKKDALIQLNEGIINRRNLEMTAKIEEYIRKGTAFIVAGAAHFTGENGIVELLRKRGYTVRQL